MTSPLKSVLCFPLIEGNATFTAAEIKDATETVLLPSTQNGHMFAMLLLCNKDPRYGRWFDAADVANLQSALQSCGDIIQAQHKFAAESLRVSQLETLMKTVSLSASELRKPPSSICP